MKILKTKKIFFKVITNDIYKYIYIYNSFFYIK